MRSFAEAGEPMPGSLTHQALLYASQDDFVGAILPFVRDGAALGEPVLVAARQRNVDALRQALNGEARTRRVELLSIGQWYENPSRTRAKFVHWAVERAWDRRVRLVGEPPWPLGSEAGVREWARHEAVINVAMADLPVTFICPYNTSELPPEVLDHARATHPELLEDGTPVDSGTYTRPDDFCRRFAGPQGPHQGAPTAEMEIDPARLGELRRLVEFEGSAAGVEPDRLGDLVVAVNEVATNALVHGARPARLRIFHRRGELLCEVGDAGAGFEDPLAGQLPPPPGVAGGFGMWITRMTGDATEVHSGEDGTTVTIHTSLAG
ncbi:MAG TPA: sensor histidine kinase [Solirubrobacterales bacterium]|nr:sensor histidine kinase [Solirubrobacterales bacterium]